MPAPQLKKIRYVDTAQTVTDVINKNFASLEWLVTGKLNGANINEKYLENFIADHIVAGDILITKGNEARVVLTESMIAMQTSEDGIIWENKVYFDSTTGQYIFDGILSADVIEALSAVITPNLYAEKATIAELTVDQLDTSTKVQNYLNGSTADVNYIKISEQYIDFIVASTDGVQDEQATDRNGMDLYWTDETCTATTTEDTGLPVMVYVYDEYVKRQIHFYNDGTNEVPRDVWGYGSGSGDNDKFFIYKPANKAVMEYFNPGSGKRTAIELSDFVDANMRRLKSAVINKAAGTIAVTMEGKSVAETIDYTETASSMTFTWPDDFTCTISIA